MLLVLGGKLLTVYAIMRADTCNALCSRLNSILLKKNELRGKFAALSRQVIVKITEYLTRGTVTPFSTADMKVNGLATNGKVMDNPFGGKAVTAYCAGLAVCLFHKVTLIQPEVYLGNALLDIYHIKIICEYL